MVLEILAAIAAGLGVGAMLPREPKDKRVRCGACWHEIHEVNYRKVVTNFRCKEPADPRCQASHCTIHCRDDKRCNGLCLKELT